MLARLVRVAASLLACPLINPASGSTALPIVIPSRAASLAYLHGTGVATRANCVQVATDAGSGGRSWPYECINIHIINIIFRGEHDRVGETTRVPPDDTFDADDPESALVEPARQR